MKKKISILLCISLFLFSGCSNKIPSLNVVSENGYLWFVDNDKTTAIIVYVSNEEEFQSIAISKDVIKDNYGTFIVK